MPLGGGPVDVIELLGPLEVHDDAGEALRQGVVDLARQPLALFQPPGLSLGRSEAGLQPSQVVHLKLHDLERDADGEQGDAPHHGERPGKGRRIGEHGQPVRIFRAERSGDAAEHGQGEWQAMKY